MQPFPFSLLRTFRYSPGHHLAFFSTAGGRRTRNKLTAPSAPSRTRLVKDLKPKSPSHTGRLEVAPRERRPFFQEIPPHFSRSANQRHPVRAKPGHRRTPSGEGRKHQQSHPRGAQAYDNRIGAVNRHRRDLRDAQDSYNNPRHSRVPYKEPPGTRSDSNGGKGPVAALTKFHDIDRQHKTLHGKLGVGDYNGISDFRSSRKIFNAKSDELPTQFTSPPLAPGLLTALRDVLGPNPKPTAIQALSLKHLFANSDEQPSKDTTVTWKQFLLASETGSGKSIAYLLPVLQHLKQSELQRSLSTSTHVVPSPNLLNPRALVLAPTHELSRQLANSAKALLHVIKLRVMCTSRANLKNPNQAGTSASEMAKAWDGLPRESSDARGDEITATTARPTHPVDIIVGTPSRLLEMVRGRFWNREDRHNGDRDTLPHTQSRKAGTGQRMGLSSVEWVVADEADVLFDPDFQEETRLLLEDISAARGHPVDSRVLFSSPSLSPQSQAGPLNYPFNLLLSSATISSALANYLDTYHPSLIRLASPNLHHLPVSLAPEYVSWTGGNRNADVEKNIKRIWAEDSNKSGKRVRSKVLVFCNKNSKVDDLSKYLTEKGISNIALTSTSDARKRGSNQHLNGFLKKPTNDRDTSPPQDERAMTSGPDIMITTSLLSRGLDFSPIVKHVFIVDEPRNMVDFLHRAGRTGRAGQSGKVVVFGRLKGRQSGKAREMKNRISTVTNQ